MGGLTIVLGFVLFQALTSAAQFYYNVDEAVERRLDLDDSTFRLQGTVTSEPATDESGAIVFTVSYNGVDAVVRHVGAEPTDLFELGIPVVSEGHWEADAFESRQLLVKHSETYEAENPDRVEYELEDGADTK
jgi:cytochrome c-type biogenesis protein CcmE